jgi:hypothetical protein
MRFTVQTTRFRLLPSGTARRSRSAPALERCSGRVCCAGDHDPSRPLPFWNRRLQTGRHQVQTVPGLSLRARIPLPRNQSTHLRSYPISQPLPSTKHISEGQQREAEHSTRQVDVMTNTVFLAPSEPGQQVQCFAHVRDDYDCQARSTHELNSGPDAPASREHGDEVREDRRHRDRRDRSLDQCTFMGRTAPRVRRQEII